MGLEPMSFARDPLIWARRLRSQTALDFLLKGVKEGDSGLIEIHAEHIRNGICDESGKLLRRWDGVLWKKIDDETCRDAS